MNPVTVTITDEYELAGYQRARCHNLVGKIRNLADEQDLGNLVQGTEDERFPELIAQLEAAKAALEAIHGN